MRAISCHKIQCREVIFVTVLMYFQVLCDPRFSFLNSFKLNLEERNLACGFKYTPRN